MVALFLGLLIYASLQGIGVVLDRSALSARLDGARPPYASRITARPLGIFLQPPTSPAWKAHFDTGRETLLAPIKIGFWLFPSLGFLGTVIGISKAIQKLPEALPSPSGGPPRRPESLNDVFSGLHFAFDTTFLGLVAAITIVIINAYLIAGWDRNEAIWRYANSRP
jgi:hypothetical protein